MIVKLLNFYFFLLVTVGVMRGQVTTNKMHLPEKGVRFYENGINQETKFILQRLDAITKNISENGITATNTSLPYTLVHQFYIPLIYSYQNNDQSLQACFDSLFTVSILNAILDSNKLSDLDKKVFLFFTSEYLRCSKVDTREKMILYNTVKRETLYYWKEKEGKVWNSEVNSFNGVKDRVNCILNGKYNGELSFYSAITDHELFVMATGVSLAITGKTLNDKDNGISEIPEIFMNSLRKLVVFYNDGTWLLQPNVWKDHRDYKNIVLGKSKIVAWDTSHFSRFPAYLSLLAEYYKEDANEDFILKLKNGLAYQFINITTSYNSSTGMFTFSNYINGNDSHYRVGYRTSPQGYKASSNNTHVFYGWWKLLNYPKISNMYENIECNFALYVKLNNNIERNKDFYKQIIILKID